MKKRAINLCFLLFVFIISSCATNIPYQIDNIDSDKFTPVLFVPGLDIGNNLPCLDMSRDKWPELYELFEEHGYDLKVACIPPNGRISALAKVLYYEIKLLFDNPKGNKKYKDKKFHIIAKSMGGLVTREMLAKYDWLDNGQHHLSDRVLSVTTISTPHFGSLIADNLMEEESCLSGNDSLDKDSLIRLQESGCDLRVSNMNNFNKTYPDKHNIPFFSFGYKIRCDSVFCKVHDWISPFYPVNFVAQCWHDRIFDTTNTENDGLVSEKSAKWGVYLGTFEGEHFAETAKPWDGIFSLFSLYKGKWIWRDVFERVIINLNRQSHI